MKIIAVDDEGIALEAIAEAVTEVCPEADVIRFLRPDAALEYVKENPCDVAFLDIQMAGITGVDLAKMMLEIDPCMNIIFTTGYSEYMGEAFGMHASGYIMKPVTAKKVQDEMNHLRHPVKEESPHRVQIRCFGNFEIFVDGKPLTFKYEKAREMMAYLVDRAGALCTSREIMLALFEDDEHTSYIRNLRKNLMDTLKDHGVDHIIVNSWGKMSILPETVDCDYFEWRKGNTTGNNSYRGEYMSQYSWAEGTAANLFGNGK